MKCNLSYGAEQDALEIARHFNKNDADLTEEFYDELNKTRRMLEKFPDIGVLVNGHFGKIRNELKNARFWPMSRFDNYGIFYQKIEKRLVILRIIHLKRNIPIIFNGLK